MNSLSDRYSLYNGVQIPGTGLGTWQTTSAATVAAIKTAIECGYRLIDTAAAYGNEASVGLGVRESGIPRDEIFITSKLRNAAHGYKATLEAFENTLLRLGVTYLDLYLIHWPNPLQFRPIWKEVMASTWKAFEELYMAKRIRAIGVSNFLPRHFEALMETATILPMVNQLRLCPGITQNETVDYCKKRNIIVQAYSPFGTGAVFGTPQMLKLAEKYQKSVGRICLRWCLQMGYVSLPKSANPARIKENTDIFNFTLSYEDVLTISNLSDVCGQAPDPDTINF